MGPWADLFLIIVLLNLLPFAVSAALAILSPEYYPKSRVISNQLARFYLLVTLIIIPNIADDDYRYISLIGLVIVAASYYCGAKRELQLLIFNCIGMLIVGLVAVVGMYGLIASI